MPKVRTPTIVNIQENICQATIEWLPDNPSLGWDWYLFKHGVFHLLTCQHIEQALERIVHIDFMSKFAISYSTAIEPFKTFRVIGLDTIRNQFLTLERTLPPNNITDTQDGSTYGVLSKYFQKIGFYRLSELFEKRKQSIFEREYGTSDPRTLVSLNNLGLIYAKQGQYKQASEVSEHLVRLAEDTLGKEHPSLLTYKVNLGGLYSQQGKFDDARNILQESLEIAERVLGKEHPQTLSAAKKSIMPCGPYSIISLLCCVLDNLGKNVGPGMAGAR